MKRSKIISFLGVLALASIALVSCGKKKGSPSNNGGDNGGSSSSETGGNSKDEDKVSYTVEVLDIDGSKLSEYNLETKKGEKSLYNDLSKVANVDASDSQYGRMINSIDGQIIDANYYISFDVNGQMAPVGVDSYELKDGDKITFRPVAWNEALDATDLLVDKLVYSYYKKAQTYATEIEYVDYQLAFAYSKMEREGYNVKSANLYTTDMKTSLVGKDDSDFKHHIALYAAGLDCSEFEHASVDLGVAYQTTIAYFYSTHKVTGIQMANEQEVMNKLLSYPMEATQTCCMTIPSIAGNPLFHGKEDFITAIKPSITKDGFKEVSEWGGQEYITCNASSTAPLIQALSALGENSRSSDYTVEGVSLIDALLSYEKDGLFYDYEGDTYYLSFATPQSIAALVSYKLLRDGKNANIYA